MTKRRTAPSQTAATLFCHPQTPSLSSTTEPFITQPLRPTKYDVFFHSPYLPIPIVNIALMTAILPFLSSVNGKHLPTPRTSDLVHRLTLDLIEMLVPPYVTALVAAELFFLAVRCLLYRHTAVFAIYSVGDGSKTALLTTLAK